MSIFRDHLEATEAGEREYVSSACADTMAADAVFIAALRADRAALRLECDKLRAQVKEQEAVIMLANWVINDRPNLLAEMQAENERLNARIAELEQSVVLEMCDCVYRNGGMASINCAICNGMGAILKTGVSL